MCVNKVAVRDLFRVRYSRTFFNCGHCPSCLQQKANARAAKIRSNSPLGSVPYFVNLTYDNDCIPYVLRKDLITASGKVKHDSLDPEFSVNYVNVYRDSKLVRGFGSTSLKKGRCSIGSIHVPFNMINNLKHYHPYENISEPQITGIRTKHRDYFSYDPDRISVAYMPDIQKFIKRLRQVINRSYGQAVPISYYQAPEYGPTSLRFHNHMLLWLPSSIPFSSVRSFILKAWPFCDRHLLSENIEVARSAASYVASYVNCDSSIPLSLLSLAPLKPSHSFHFGFDKDVYTFSSIVQKFISSRAVSYLQEYIGPNGSLQSRELPYPKYVTSRYFPKVKGFNRINSNTLISFYCNPTRFAPDIQCPRGVTQSGQTLFQSGLVDVYGNVVTFTRSEFLNIFNSIYRFHREFASLGFSPYEASCILLDFYKARSSFIYKSVFKDVSTSYDLLNCYFNVSDMVSMKPVRSDLQHILTSYYNENSLNADYLLKRFDPNNLPNEVLLTNFYSSYFYSKVKQRKFKEL